MENKRRLIDAYTLAKEVYESQKDNPHKDGQIATNHRCEHEHFLKMICLSPTVDAVEVVHGQWIEHPHIGYDGGYNGANYKCSICGFDDVYDTEEYNYCPNCGAKMDGDENG